MAAARSPLLALTLLLLLLYCGCGAATVAAADQELIHLHFYMHEVNAGQPNATIVTVASLHKNASMFGDVSVVDNPLREGPDPASRLIGRLQGVVVRASLDGSSIFTAGDFVFSGGHRYSGSSVSTQGPLSATLGPSERSIVGGTGKLRFARGYMTSELLSATDTALVIVLDMYFTLAH